MSQPANLESQVRAFADDLAALRQELTTMVVGQAELIEGVIMGLFGGGHVLLEGVPGLGKTMLVRSLAACIDASFARIQFTPDLMPADIIGTNVITEDERGKRFEFARGPIFANVVLADEINRATPKTQAALLEAMSESSVTVAKQTHKLDAPFFVLATQNPLEMEGTYPLPEAQLDRFAYKLLVTFPTRAELHTIMDRTTGQTTPTLHAVMGKQRLGEMRALVRAVAITPQIQDAAVSIVLATHPDQAESPAKVKQFVRYGASTRGLQAMILGAKLRALAAGRYAVALDDIKHVAAPALRHRILLNFEGEAEGVAPDALLADIVAELSKRL